MSLRRNRDNRHIRELTREVRLHVEQFIQPLFAVEGLREREAVPGLVDVYRDTSETLLQQIEADLAQGISKFLLFGVPARKQDRDFSHAATSDIIATVRRRFGSDIWLAVDVCLCSHTTHGHCGILNDNRDHVLNDASVSALADAALQFAQAGADCVAPSDMQDGRVAAIRSALDQAGLERRAIMSYAAKFDSAFYGPFRLAAESAPGRDLPLRDRASYQIDPARPGDALLCARIHKPWAVYQTSGEQAGIDLLAEHGLTNPVRAQLESWTAFSRAGASMIISYAARRARRYLAA